MRAFIVSLLLLTAQFSWGAVSNQEVSTFRIPFTFTGFTLATLDAEHVQDGGAKLGTYSFISAHYRYRPGAKFVFRLPFFYSTAGFDDFSKDFRTGAENAHEQETGLADPIIEHASNHFFAPLEIDVYWANRVYIPISDSSRAQKMIARIRSEFIATKSLSRDFELEYWPQFSYYIQSQPVYQNNFGSVSNTRSFRIDQRVTAWYKASPKLNFGLFFGTRDHWYNDSEFNSTSRQRSGRLAEHSVQIGPSMSFEVGNRFNFIMNVSNVIGLHGFYPERTGTQADIGKFKANQTEFALLTFIRL